MNSIELIDKLINQVKLWEYPLKKQKDSVEQFMFQANTILSQTIRRDNPHFIELFSTAPNAPFYYLKSDNPVSKPHFDYQINTIIYHLEAIKEELFFLNEINSSRSPEKSRESQTHSKKVFIVHGHDEKMKLSAARILDKLGLEAIILHEQPNLGRTIIEKFQEYSDVGYAIVLFSPDDMGYSTEKKPDEAKSRARQNVILELGYFLGKLGRQRVIVLYSHENNFEMPSDFSGILYVEFDNLGKWKFDLVRELKACGYNVNANDIL